MSVTECNLVPSDLDCNTDKSTSTFNPYVEQPFHLYYDDYFK